MGPTQRGAPLGEGFALMCSSKAARRILGAGGLPAAAAGRIACHTRIRGVTAHLASAHLANRTLITTTATIIGEEADGTLLLTRAYLEGRVTDDAIAWTMAVPMVPIAA